MKDGGIGRVLVASLHQAIADLLPTRLEFYENWLNPWQLREGRIGLAPLAAVVSFLRQEGDTYFLVTSRAGEYAAEWTMEALPGLQRAIYGALPIRVRSQIALQLARRMIRKTYPGTRAIVRWRRGAGEIDVRGSLFCGVREPGAQPLCQFYAAAITRFLWRLGVDGEAHVGRCRALGDSGCVLSVAVRGAKLNDEAAVYAAK